MLKKLTAPFLALVLILTWNNPAMAASGYEEVYLNRGGEPASSAAITITVSTGEKLHVKVKNNSDPGWYLQFEVTNADTGEIVTGSYYNDVASGELREYSRDVPSGRYIITLYPNGVHSKGYGRISDH